MKYWLGVWLLLPNLAFAQGMITGSDAIFEQRYDELSAPPISCESLICVNQTEVVSVPALTITPPPTKKSNETLDAVGSALYFIGEMGLAENLSEPSY